MADGIVLIEAINCPLCNEPFETAEPHTPCVLDCFHTYCRKCLADWANKGRAAPAGGPAAAAAGAACFSCPTCRAVCTVPVAALKINYALMTVVEAERVSTGQTKLVCQDCGEEEATLHCQECSLLLCTVCSMRNRKTKLQVCKHNTLQTSDEFKQRKQALPQKRLCKKHSDWDVEQVLNLYCETCQTPICYHGTLDDHKTHDHRLLKDVALQHQAELCMEADKVSKIQTTLEEGIAKIKKEEDTLATKAIEQKALIGTHFEELRAVLRARELALTREVDEALAKKSKMLGGQREGLEFAVASMASGSLHARKTAELGDKLQVMDAFGQTIKGLRQLREMTYDLHPVTSADFSFVDTSSGSLSHTLSQHARVVSAAQARLTFEFEEAFDEKGVLYHFGTVGGTRPYRNPHTHGSVVASLSSTYLHRPQHSSAARFVQGASHDDQANFTANQAGSWMAVDLKRLLAPNHYCLRSGSANQYCTLRDWRLEGSKDGSSWTCLREHVNDSSLAETAFGVAAWPIENASAAVFRHFRVFQTGKHSGRGDTLACAGIELYGTLLPEEHA